MSKTFVGVRLRQLRTERGLSQASLAKTLEISASYLNQIEHDVRPLTVPVLLRISEVFGVDTTFFSPQDDTRLIAEMREVALDQEMGIDADAHEIAEMVSTHPGLAKAMVNMHRRFRNTTAQLAAATEDRFSDGSGSGSITMPHEEVRDYFYQRQNYIHDLDTAAEELTARMRFHRGDVAGEIARRLESVHDVQIVRRVDLGENILHRYDPDTRSWKFPQGSPAGNRSSSSRQNSHTSSMATCSTRWWPRATSPAKRRFPWRSLVWPTISPQPPCCPTASFTRLPRTSGTTSSACLPSIPRATRRSATASRPCSAPNFAGFRSCSCVSIVPETCRSVSPPPDSTSLPAAVRAAVERLRDVLVSGQDHASDRADARRSSIPLGCAHGRTSSGSIRTARKDLRHRIGMRDSTRPPTRLQRRSGSGRVESGNADRLGLPCLRTPQLSAACLPSVG